MHGNVSEYVADHYAPTLPGGTDPLVRLEKGGDHIVLRGGAWCSTPGIAGRDFGITPGSATTTYQSNWRSAPPCPSPHQAEAMTIRPLIPALLTLVASHDSAAAAAPPVQALFQNACTDCHGGANPKGAISLEGIDYRLAAGSDLENWTKVLDQLVLGEMPPEDGDEITEAERAEAVAWIRGEMVKAGHAPENKLERPGYGTMCRTTCSLAKARHRPPFRRRGCGGCGLPFTMSGCARSTRTPRSCVRSRWARAVTGSKITPTNTDWAVPI
ncbi:MAG: c-type cytochrome [Verrucomicrobiales bacterium]